MVLPAVMPRERDALVYYYIYICNGFSHDGVACRDAARGAQAALRALVSSEYSNKLHHHHHHQAAGPGVRSPTRRQQREHKHCTCPLPRTNVTAAPQHQAGADQELFQGRAEQ